MSTEIKDYLERGAVVLDVRTLEEWNEGHVEGSKHIVLTVIPLELEQIKSWGKPVIAVFVEVVLEVVKPPSFYLTMV